MASSAPRTLLTDAELELMLILWRLEEGTVRDVLAELPDGRNMAYTTASTIIRILEKKGFVQSRKQGKGHVYSPLVSKDSYESRSLGHMMGKLFDNTPATLVARLIDDHELSQEQLAEIRQLLKNKG